MISWKKEVNQVVYTNMTLSGLGYDDYSLWLKTE
jgi:hypothetical protein